MEKPEWFETVDALESAPKQINTSSARAHKARLTQGFALFGIGAVIAVGGFAFVSNSAPSTLSASGSPVSTTSAPAALNAPAPASAAIGSAGGQPSITSAVGGENND